MPVSKPQNALDYLNINPEPKVNYGVQNKGIVPPPSAGQVPVQPPVAVKVKGVTTLVPANSIFAPGPTEAAAAGKDPSNPLNRVPVEKKAVTPVSPLSVNLGVNIADLQRSVIATQIGTEAQNQYNIENPVKVEVEEEIVKPKNNLLFEPFVTTSEYRPTFGEDKARIEEARKAEVKGKQISFNNTKAFVKGYNEYISENPLPTDVKKEEKFELFKKPISPEVQKKQDLEEANVRLAYEEYLKSDYSEKLNTYLKTKRYYEDRAKNPRYSEEDKLLDKKVSDENEVKFMTEAYNFSVTALNKNIEDNKSSIKKLGFENYELLTEQTTALITEQNAMFEQYKLLPKGTSPTQEFVARYDELTATINKNIADAGNIEAQPGFSKALADLQKDSEEIYNISESAKVFVQKNFQDIYNAQKKTEEQQDRMDKISRKELDVPWTEDIEINVTNAAQKVLSNIPSAFAAIPLFVSNLMGDGYNGWNRAYDVLNKITQEFHAANPDEGHYKLSADGKSKTFVTDLTPELVGVGTNVAVMILETVLGTRALLALSTLERAEVMVKVATFATGYVNTAYQFYNAGIDAGMSVEDATLFAQAQAIPTAFIEVINPEAGLFVKTSNVAKKSAEEYMRVFIKGGPNARQLAWEASGIIVKNVRGELIEENSDLFKELGVNHLTNKTLGTNLEVTKDLVEKVKHTSGITTIISTIVGGGGAAFHIMKSTSESGKNQLFNDAIYNAAENPDVYKKLIIEQTQEGKLFEKDAAQVADIVNTAEMAMSRIGNIDEASKRGTLPYMMQKINLEEQKKKVDPIYHPEIDKKIAELDKAMLVISKTKSDEVAQLRADEQEELKSSIPNIEDYKVDGNVDRNKITDEKVLKKFDKIYDKYDKLISPLLPAKPTQKAKADVAGSGVVGEVEIKNEGKANVPTKENIDERLRINHPFYEKVSDVLNKLGLINKYNPETKEGDFVGGYSQPTSDGGFSVGDFIFNKDGSISFLKDGARVEFDKNGNVISENTKEVKAQKQKNEIESKKESIKSLEKLRDSEEFKYKTVNEYDVLGNSKKVKRLKTPQELKESTDKINTQIDNNKSELSESEQSIKETPKAGSVGVGGDVELTKSEKLDAEENSIKLENATPTRNVFTKPFVDNNNYKEEAAYYKNNKDKATEEDVSIDDISPTQLTIDKSFQSKSKELPVLIKDENGIHVLDGHHRIAEQVRDGATKIKAKVLDQSLKATPKEGSVDADAIGGKRLVQPEKPISEMNSEELSDYSTMTRKALKAQDKEFEGKTEKEKEDAGYYDYIDDVEDSRDAAQQVNDIENAENINDLSESTESALRNFDKDKPSEYSLAVLNAVKKKTAELNIPTKNLIKAVVKRVGNKYQDIDDAETMVRAYLEKLIPTQEVKDKVVGSGVGGDVELKNKSKTGILVNTTAHKLVGVGMNFFNRSLGQFLPEFITRKKGTEKNAEAKDEYTELTQEQANKIYDNLLNAADEGKISAESFVTRIKAVKSYLETVDTPKAKELLSKLNDVLPNLEANIEKLQKDTKEHLDDKAKGGKGDIDNVWQQRKQFEKLDLSALKTDDLFEAVEQSLPTQEVKQAKAGDQAKANILSKEGETLTGKTTDELPALSKEEREVDDAIENAKRSLASTGIEIVTDPKQVREAMEKDGQKSSHGLFVAKDGKIYLDRERFQKGFGRSIVWHEAAHPVINILRNTNRPLYDKVVAGLKKIRGNEGVDNVIEWAQENYKKERWDDESVVESIAAVGDGRIDPNTLPKSFRQTLINAVNEFAKMLGFDQVLDDTDIGAFKKLAAKVSGAIKTGKDISSIVGKDNVKKLEYTDSKGNVIKDSQFNIQSNYSDRQSGITFEYTKYEATFKKLKDAGFITEDKQLADFKGMSMAAHSPDAMFTGTISKNGNIMVKGKGGIFYPIKFHKDGYFWASTKDGASSLAKLLNESAKENNGKVLMALISAPQDKLLSSTTSANAVIDIFLSKALDEKFGIDETKVKKAIIRAATKTTKVKGKKVGLKMNNLNDNMSTDEIVSKVRERLAAEKSIFPDRKLFSEDVIKGVVKGLNKKQTQALGEFFYKGLDQKEMMQQGGELGMDKENAYKLSVANVRLSISYMLSEPLLRETETNKVYAVIEMDVKNPSVEKDPKTGESTKVYVKPVDAKGPDDHESYPMAIKSTDQNSKVTVHILQDRSDFNTSFVDPETGGEITKERKKKVFPTYGVSTTTLKVSENLEQSQASTGERKQSLPKTVAGVTYTELSKKRQDSLREDRSKKEYFDDEVTAMKKSKLSDEELKRIVKDEDFGILTGQNPDNTPTKDDVNEKLNKKAEEWISEKGYTHHKVTGRYNQTENSFLVPGLTADHAVEFAKEFNQESVVTNEGLIYQDGTMNPREKESDSFDVDVSLPDANYASAVRTKDGSVKGFSVGIDFDGPKKKSSANKPNESQASKGERKEVKGKVVGSGVDAKADIENRRQEGLNKDRVLLELRKITSKETFENAETEGQIEQRVIFIKEHSKDEVAKKLANEWLNIKNYPNQINAKYDAEPTTQEVKGKVRGSDVVDNPALKDVESTTKALEEPIGENKAGLYPNVARVSSLLDSYILGEKLFDKLAYIGKEHNKRIDEGVDYESSTAIYDKEYASKISEAYHKAKADGSNPELVKAVESLLSKEQPKAESVGIEENTDEALRSLKLGLVTPDGSKVTKQGMDLEDLIKVAFTVARQAVIIGGDIKVAIEKTLKTLRDTKAYQDMVTIGSAQDISIGDRITDEVNNISTELSDLKIHAGAKKVLADKFVNQEIKDGLIAEGIKYRPKTVEMQSGDAKKFVEFFESQGKLEELEELIYDDNSGLTPTTRVNIATELLSRYSSKANAIREYMELLDKNSPEYKSLSKESNDLFRKAGAMFSLANTRIGSEAGRALQAQKELYKMLAADKVDEVVNIIRMDAEATIDKIVEANKKKIAKSVKQINDLWDQGLRGDSLKRAIKRVIEKNLLKSDIEGVDGLVDQVYDKLSGKGSISATELSNRYRTVLQKAIISDEAIEGIAKHMEVVKLREEQKKRVDEMIGYYRSDLEQASRTGVPLTKEEVAYHNHTIFREWKALEKLDLKAQEAIEKASKPFKDPRDFYKTLTGTLKMRLLSPLSLFKNISGYLPYVFIHPVLKIPSSVMDWAYTKTTNLFRGEKVSRSQNFLLDIVGYNKYGFPFAFREAVRRFWTGKTNPNIAELDTTSGLNSVTAWTDIFRHRRAGERGYVENKISAIVEAISPDADLISRLLAGPDVLVRKTAERGAVFSMAKNQNLSGPDLWDAIINPPKEVKEVAEEIGARAAYQNKNQVAKLLDEIGSKTESIYIGRHLKGLAKFLLKEPNIPFVTTPINIVSAGLKLTMWPVSLAAAVWNIKKSYTEQEKGNKVKSAYYRGRAIESFSMMGFALAAGSFALEMLLGGALTGAADKEDKDIKSESFQHKHPNSLNYSAVLRKFAGNKDWSTPALNSKGENTDTWIHLAGLGPIGVALATHANVYQSMDVSERNNTSLSWNTLSGIEAIPSAMRAALDQTYLAGAHNLMDAIFSQDPKGTFMTNYLKTISTTFLPNTLAAMSRSSSEYMRDTKGGSVGDRFKAGLKERLFMGDELPTKVTVWGSPVSSLPPGTNKYAYYFLDPFQSYNVNTQSFKYLLFDFYNNTGIKTIIPTAPENKIVINKEPVELSPKEYEEYQTIVGKMREAETEKYVLAGDFKTDDQDTRVATLNRIYDGTKEQAKRTFIMNNERLLLLSGGMESSDPREMLRNMRSGGEMDKIREDINKMKSGGSSDALREMIDNIKR